ncbi:MAG TPA: hypothetical protein VF530_12555 [Planctomycetota bacterium]
MQSTHRAFLLTVPIAMLLSSACTTPVKPAPGQQAPVQTGDCILDIRPRPSPNPPSIVALGAPAPMHSTEPMFMDLLYEIEKPDGQIPFLTFRFKVGTSPVQVWPRRQTPYLAPQADYFELSGPKEYALTVSFMSGAEGSPDQVVLRVYDTEEAVVLTKKKQKDSLRSHYCFGPASAAEPMATPWLVELDNGKKSEKAIGVEFDGLGIESGFALVGEGLLRLPRWLTAAEGEAAFNTGDCILDPRPKPKPAPGEGGGAAGRAGAARTADPHYDTLEFYATGPTEKGGEYVVDLFLTVGHAGLALAPHGDPDSGDRIELAAGTNHVQLKYNSRFLLRDQVEITVEGPSVKKKRLRTSLPDLRPAGHFRAPRFVPYGRAVDDEGNPTLTALALELEVFGVPTGICLVGKGLRIRKDRRPESLSSPW